MKIKFILLLFFSFSQLPSHSQISSDQYFRNFRTLKKSFEKNGYTLKKYMVLSETLYKNDIDLVLDGKTFVTVSLFHSFNCDVDFGVTSKNKIFGLEKNTPLKKDGVYLQSWSFVSNYNQKFNFWAEIKNKCKSKGNGTVFIHIKK